MLGQILGNVVLILGGFLMLLLANVFLHPIVRLAFALGGILLFIIGIKGFARMIEE